MADEVDRAAGALARLFDVQTKTTSGLMNALNTILWNLIRQGTIDRNQLIADLRKTLNEVEEANRDDPNVNASVLAFRGLLLGLTSEEEGAGLSEQDIKDMLVGRRDS